jgi:photosystem II stability/assembly factor-like uncharacterized protein
MFFKKICNGVLSTLILIIILAGCDLQDSAPIDDPSEQFQQAGLQNLEINSFHIEGDILFANTEDGIWSSQAGVYGASWDSENLSGLNAVDLVTLSDGSQLAGVQRDNVQSGDPVIYRRDHQSGDWDPFEQNYGGTENYNYINRIDNHPTNADLLFARGAAHAAKSSDGGENWQVVLHDWDTMGYQADLLEFDPHNSERVWAGGEAAVLRPYLVYSNNLGDTWNGINVDVGDDDAVYSMAFHPEDEEHLLIGMEGEIRYTTDMGETLGQSFENDLYHYIHAMATPNGELSETVFASGTEYGAQGGNVYFLVTNDFGENWEKFSSEYELDQIGINDIKVIESGGETVIYLATTEGVWTYRMQS